MDYAALILPLESELSAKTVRRTGSVSDRQAQGSEFVHNGCNRTAGFGGRGRLSMPHKFFE